MDLEDTDGNALLGMSEQMLAALASVCIVNSLPLVSGPRGAREGR